MTTVKKEAISWRKLLILTTFSGRQKQRHINSAPKKKKIKKYLRIINAKFRTAMACWYGKEV